MQPGGKKKTSVFIGCGSCCFVKEFEFKSFYTKVRTGTSDKWPSNLEYVRH